MWLSQPLISDNRLDRFFAALILAQAYLAMNRLEEAEEMCKQAMLGRRLALGKSHKDYRESVSLFASICEQRGDTEMAFAYRAFIPFRFEPNPHSALYTERVPDAMVLPQDDRAQDVSSEGAHDVSSSFGTPDAAHEQRPASSTLQQPGDSGTLSPPSYSETVEQSSYAHNMAKLDPITESNQLAISSLLAAGFYLQNVPFSKARKAFRWACEEGNEAAVKWLLPKINNINDGLQRASKAGHVSVVKLLVQRGANIEAGGRTPLVLAASNSKDEVVREALLLGADTLPREKYIRSPLFHAIKNGHEACVRAILDSPSKTGIWHNEGAKEIDQACRLGDSAIIKLVLEAGAGFGKLPMETGHITPASTICM